MKRPDLIANMAADLVAGVAGNQVDLGDERSVIMWLQQNHPFGSIAVFSDRAVEAARTIVAEMRGPQ